MSTFIRIGRIYTVENAENALFCAYIRLHRTLLKCTKASIIFVCFLFALSIDSQSGSWYYINIKLAERGSRMNVKRLREDRELTQQQVADMIGVDERDI